MGPAPSLATYEAQAKSVYEPQLQAEQTQLTAQHTANLNTLGTEKQSVGTQYDIQEQGLQQQIKQETAQINQLYSTRLLGNFSGLQGNDMGEMFARSNQTYNNIETQRTNAINAISTNVANENLKYTANQSALTSKYQGLEEGAAQSGYASAVKEYNQEQYQQQQLQARYAQIAATREAAAAREANNPATIQRSLTSQIGQALQNAAGRDGYVRPSDYQAAKQDWISQGFSSASFDQAFAGFRNPYAEDINNGAKRSKADYGVG